MLFSLLVEDFLSLRWAESLHLQTGLVDVQHSEAEEGVPHLTNTTDKVNKCYSEYLSARNWTGVEGFLNGSPRCSETHLEIKICLWEVLVQRRRQELCCHHDDTAESKQYIVSLQNEGAAKNRWRNLQHKRHLQSRIIGRESDLMVGCIPLPSSGQRLHERNGKQTHWLVRSLMTLQSRGKIVSFIRLRNTQKIFNRNSCQGIY